MHGQSEAKGDWAKFLGTWLKHPGAMGAIAASSRSYCDAMVRAATTHLDGPILELGAGLGVVTQALLRAGIAPERITSIEYDREFARELKARFPNVNVIQGDGLDLTETLKGREEERFAAILLAIPIIRFKPDERRRLLERYFERIVPAGNLTQLSYSLTPPVKPELGAYAVSSTPVVWANLPPARVWIYNRVGDGARSRG
ncbi:class I SAM-dependent methyltransferase [Aureimonas populi]|uniref:Class I SAM-dependent methyltransferase n=1 Tax=Aureimonas populi TaxID=1701758 RepID=A0ABW5CQ77_9HYPH|nr:methyltransferase domain-containing protein [Aureimonas populi]